MNIPRMKSAVQGITVAELFRSVRLRSHGPLQWDKLPPLEEGPGVYVVAITRDAQRGCRSFDTSYLVDPDASRWLNGQSVIYIGRTKRSLKRRLAEFYRHTYGRKTPHRGGQAVKLLLNYRPLWVFWASTSKYIEAERTMIDTFKERSGGRLPFANQRS